MKFNLNTFNVLMSKQLQESYKIIYPKKAEIEDKFIKKIIKMSSTIKDEFKIIVAEQMAEDLNHVMKKEDFAYLFGSGLSVVNCNSTTQLIEKNGIIVFEPIISYRTTPGIYILPKDFKILSKLYLQKLSHINEYYNSLIKKKELEKEEIDFFESINGLRELKKELKSSYLMEKIKKNNISQALLLFVINRYFKKEILNNFSIRPSLSPFKKIVINNTSFLKGIEDKIILTCIRNKKKFQFFQIKEKMRITYMNLYNKYNAIDEMTKEIELLVYKNSILTLNTFVSNTRIKIFVEEKYRANIRLALHQDIRCLNWDNADEDIEKKSILLFDKIALVAIDTANEYLITVTLKNFIKYTAIMPDVEYGEDSSKKLSDLIAEYEDSLEKNDEDSIHILRIEIDKEIIRLK